MFRRSGHRFAGKNMRREKDLRMFRKKHAPDVIRGGDRICEEDMRK
jgi:hypothetical protein